MTSTAPDRPLTEPGSGLAGLLDELRWRGLFEDATPGLAPRLATGRSISGYNGFDPSGPSLHVGHLVPVFGLLHLQRRGGRPIVLVGGATGMIGDPSGTSAERNLLDRATLDANVAGIRSQLESFLDFTGPTGALMVNNLDWLGEIGMLDFLRDVGKHFTIPYMLAKDSVQGRLGGGLSYTEFSYMLLQAADFRHLQRTQGVELQSGGADQWGNITAGLELIRRSEGLTADGAERAHALAYRLLLDPSGAKFGKTAAGTSVWLDPGRTSPFAFYQYWLAREDSEVGTLLRLFTLLARDEIEALEAEQATSPEARPAQRVLARDITTRVHGETAAGHAMQVSEAAFSREPIRDVAVLATLHEAVAGFAFSDDDVRGGALAIALVSGLFGSAGDARRTIGQGGFTVNDERLAAPDAAVPEPIAGEWLVVRAGKRRLAVGRRAR